MRQFELDGIRLSIPAECLTPPLTDALKSGRYEHTEAGALKRHLEPDDTVLDIGAGAGYLSAVAARLIGAANVTAVEANAEMIDAVRANLDANGAGETRLIHGAVVPDGFEGSHVEFHMRKAFWASTIGTDASPKGRLARVPALNVHALLAEHRPSVVILDIEGGEETLFDRPWPAHVRMLIMEIHSGKYPPRSIQRIFDGLSRSDMTYQPWGSRAETLVFQRIPAD